MQFKRAKTGQYQLQRRDCRYRRWQWKREWTVSPSTLNDMASRLSALRGNMPHNHLVGSSDCGCQWRIYPYIPTGYYSERILFWLYCLMAVQGAVVGMLLTATSSAWWALFFVPVLGLYCGMVRYSNGKSYPEDRVRAFRYRRLRGAVQARRRRRRVPSPRGQHWLLKCGDGRYPVCNAQASGVSHQPLCPVADSSAQGAEAMRVTFLRSPNGRYLLWHAFDFDRQWARMNSQYMSLNFLMERVVRAESGRLSERQKSDYRSQWEGQWFIGGEDAVPRPVR